VAVLLFLLLAQGVTGLFNSDDVLFDGPLRHAVDTELAGTLGSWHEVFFNALVAMIGLHLSAIAWYQWRNSQPLIQAMWRGRSGERVGRAAAAPLWLALLALGLAAALLWGVISQAPPPPSYW
jgi:cytochrome b